MRRLVRELALIAILTLPAQRVEVARVRAVLTHGAIPHPAFLPTSIVFDRLKPPIGLGERVIPRGMFPPALATSLTSFHERVTIEGVVLIRVVLHAVGFRVLPLALRTLLRLSIDANH